MSVNFGSYLITNGKMNSAQNNSENCNTISVSFLFFLFDFFFENTEILKYEILTEKVWPVHQEGVKLDYDGSKVSYKCD